MKKTIILLAILITLKGAFAMDSTLTRKELAIIDLAAAVARGEQAALAAALNAGFEAGLTLNEAKELVKDELEKASGGAPLSVVVPIKPDEAPIFPVS